MQCSACNKYKSEAASRPHKDSLDRSVDKLCTQNGKTATSFMGDCYVQVCLHCLHKSRKVLTIQRGGISTKRGNLTDAICFTLHIMRPFYSLYTAK